MRVMFGNWKYIIRNLWYVLPLAVMPAVFLALSHDYTAISAYVKNFFAGEPRADFVTFFRALSFVRADGWLGVVYSVLAVVCAVFFGALLLSFTEKHMRIGKRTPGGGCAKQFVGLILPTAGMTLFYLALYEIWAVVLAAVMTAISSVSSTPAVYVFDVIAFLFTGFVLIFVVEMFYLWLPCMQITGFRPYDALVYSCRLAIGVRRRLIGAIALSFAIATVAVAALSLLSAYVFLPVVFLLDLFLFLGFIVRMETVYFETDKIDREDLIRSYREL
ncbi:MAG: hypothetical protein ACI4ST_05700 [Candidatus Gallimonas sp.]